MSDWGKDLEEALRSGDLARMQAVLAQVPKEVLVQGAPQLAAHAARCASDGRLDDAIACYGQLLAVDPAQVDWLAARATTLQRLGRYAESAEDAERIVAAAPMRVQGYRLLAEARQALGDRAAALDAWRKALHCAPGDAAIASAIDLLETALRDEATLRRALDPASVEAEDAVEPPPLPRIEFDPALFDDASLPANAESAMLDGLRQHLRRYSGQESCKHALARLSDPVWREAWDRALSVLGDAQVLLHGSELGVLALRALAHGARRALAAEAHPLDARIAGGIAHKHFLKAWHSQYGAEIPTWTEEQRRASFEAFASAIEIVDADRVLRGEGADEALSVSGCDAFVFPNLDHSLLGTGIVAALRRFRAAGLVDALRVLPARARVFAIGIRWNETVAGVRLDALEALRWNAYPQALEASADSWTAITAPALVAEIDFAAFVETRVDAELPVIADGEVQALVYWFELDLGPATVNNAPPNVSHEGERLRCLQPALQYTDPVAVRADGVLRVQADIREHRLHLRTDPPATRARAHAAPSWLLSRQFDPVRNAAYAEAIASAVSASAPAHVLELGASSGLLSMLAARAGAASASACEANPTLRAVAEDAVARNGLSERVRFVAKDSRRAALHEDVPAPADLAVFEMFDCSLIGEGVLHYLADARARLLAADARLLPMSATIRAMVIECRLDRFWDIDVNLLNPYRFATSFLNVDARSLDYRPLSEAFEVFAFDFASADPAPQTREFELPAIADGAAGAVLFWFDLRLDDARTLSNDPRAARPARWGQGLQWIPEARVAAASTLPLVAQHNGSALKFQWKKDGLPAAAFSQLPLFDPRWLAANAELEQRTRGLLQHCLQHPEEYARVAELAKRFAIEPSAHGIDPVVAQRFAAAFIGL